MHKNLEVIIEITGTAINYRTEIFIGEEPIKKLLFLFWMRRHKKSRHMVT
jgi:hypothetical protein